MTLILHGFPFSANTYRVRLLLNQIPLEHEFRKIDLLQGEHKRGDFMKLNPLGLVPVLEDDGHVLRDSHVIVLYLAEQYGKRFLPTRGRFEILEWLLFDATELHYGVGLLRNHLALRLPGDVSAIKQRAESALRVLNAHLEERSWLVLEQATLADIACYPFIGVLPEAGLCLSDYPALQAWAERVESLSNFLPMPRLPGRA